MADVRIFVSVDMDHDADLCDLLVAQSRQAGSGFAVAGHSETSADPENRRARKLIREAQQVICMCGEHTDESLRSLAELRIAQEENKPYFLLWGRRGIMCKRPGSARADDAMYSWTEPILRTQIAVTLRNALPREIPEACKRPAARTPVPTPVPTPAPTPD